MLINVENLKTARKNAGYTTLEATKRACPGTKSNRVEQWEAGELSPTWNQLKNLAEAYQINVFLLTSKEKLTRDRKIMDYRKKEMGGELELNTKKFINLLLQRQNYLAYIMKEEGARKNSLVGIAKNYQSSGAKKTAQLIVEKIGYQYDSLRNNRLKYLISLIEEKGIFVMKTLSYWKISVSNMRGVYLKNEYAPVIALNRKDAKTAQLFTLAHELAHLFINSEGISNIDFRDRSSDPTERFCNAVAANLLLPEKQIEKKYHRINDIEKLARRFEVSELCVFYRLKNLSLIETEKASLIEQHITEKSKEHVESKHGSDSSGGGHINNMKDSNGYLFNNFISALYSENRINAAEASKILKMSISYGTT